MKKITLILFTLLVFFGSCKTILISTAGMSNDDILREGLRARNEGNFALAQRYYRRAIAQQPDRQEGHLLLALAYTAQQRYRQAEKVYRRALRRNPNDRRFHSMKAEFHALHTENFQKAAKLYQEAVRLDPESMSDQFNLGIMWANLGKYEQAVAQFQIVIDSTDYCFEEAFLYLYEIHCRQGNEAGKIEVMRQAVERGCRFFQFYCAQMWLQNFCEFEKAGVIPEKLREKSLTLHFKIVELQIRLFKQKFKKQ